MKVIEARLDLFFKLLEIDFCEIKTQKASKEPWNGFKPMGQ